MVTPEAPVNAVNNAQVTNATNARPPGISHQIPGKGEKRQGQQQRRVGDPVNLNGDHGQVNAQSIKSDQGNRQYDGKQGRTHSRQ
jgi:hypothetical protein